MKKKNLKNAFKVLIELKLNFTIIDKEMFRLGSEIKFSIF